MIFFTSLLVVMMLHHRVLGFEPECQCSRFHYEEKTLEKMIKTEMFVDKMKADIGEKQNEINVKMEEMKQELAEAKKAVQVLSDSVSAASEPRKTGQERVAFLARNVQDNEPSDGETIIFTDVEVNEGQAYDSSTGVFTVPVDGVYMLSLQLCPKGNRYFYWKIKADSKEILSGCVIDENSSYEGCSSASGVALLKSGSRVFMEAGSSSAGTDLSTDKSMWHYFSGTLVN